MFNCLNYANWADISSRGKEEGAGHFKGVVPDPPSPSDPKAAFMGRHMGPGFPSAAWEAGHGAVPLTGITRAGHRLSHGPHVDAS